MDKQRTSLWARLAVFYAKTKPEQLNANAIAEILAKYGSREKELSARLRKKYGQPLPSAVLAQDVQKVSAEFNLEDHDFDQSSPQIVLAAEDVKIKDVPPDADGAPGAASDADVTSSPTAQDTSAADAATEKRRRSSPTQGRDEGSQEDLPPGGSTLDFRSKHFDALQALRHRALRPPFPNERALDNLAKFYRLLPSPAPARTATRTKGGGKESATARIAEVSGRAASGAGAVQQERAAVPRASCVQGQGEGSHSAGLAKPVIGDGKGSNSPDAVSQDQSVVGYYGSTLRSATEMEMVDKKLAHSRRGVELSSAKGVVDADGSSRINPLQRIMQDYAGIGPYSLLHRLHAEKRRASVMIRRVNSIRGTCTGLIRAFDKHMNLLLADVREDYTAFVPIRDPQPRAHRSRDEPQKKEADTVPGLQQPGDTATADVCCEGSMARTAVGRRARDSSISSTTGRIGKSTFADVSSENIPMETNDTATRLRCRSGDRSGQESERRKTSTVADDPQQGNECLAHGLDLDGGSAISSRTTTHVAAKEVDAGLDRKAIATILGNGHDGGADAYRDSGTSAGVNAADEGGKIDGSQARKTRKSRRSRQRGPWKGDLEPVRRRRYLKQLLIRGDNVVMVWQTPTS